LPPTGGGIGALNGAGGRTDLSSAITDVEFLAGNVATESCNQQRFSNVKTDKTAITHCS